MKGRMKTNSLANTPLKAAHPPLDMARTSQVDFVVGNDIICRDTAINVCCWATVRVSFVICKVPELSQRRSLEACGTSLSLSLSRDIRILLFGCLVYSMTADHHINAQSVLNCVSCFFISVLLM